jgi:signal peptidase II
MSSEAIHIESNASKLWYLMITTLALALDQFTKYWVARTLSLGDEVPVIDGFFNISYTENPGIAFGMLSDANVKWLLVAISMAAIFIVTYYLMRVPVTERLLLWALALLASGIAGNLIDRIRWGKVIDFLGFYYNDWHFPVFNVADTAITIGASLMAIELLFSKPPPKMAEETEAKPVATEMSQTKTDEGKAES